MNSDKGLPREEYERMWRVLDMSLSAHSLLRDRYRRRHLGLTLLVMALSIVATSLALLSSDRILRVGRFSARLDVLLGVLTALIFFLALVDLIVDWRRLAWMHDDSTARLSELKRKFRAVTVVGDSVDSGGVDLIAEYEQTMAIVASIPERQFLGMKAKHHRKVVVSKLIDAHKGAPVLYVRLLAMWKGLRRSGPEKKETAGPAEPVEEPPT